MKRRDKIKRGYEQTPDDLWRLFLEKLEGLKVSGESYDKGNFFEAKRLATDIRVLVHKSTHSTPLLEHMKSLGITFMGTPFELSPGNLLADFPLLMMQVSTEGVNCIPVLNSGPFSSRGWKRQKLKYWWEETILIDSRRRSFSRKNIVTWMANQDGGAHVDSHLDEDYAHISRKNALGFVFIKNGTEHPMVPSPEYPMVRQIAFEITNTLESQIEIIRQNNFLGLS